MKGYLIYLLSLQILLSKSFTLEDLVLKLHDYQKKWVSGINARFQDKHVQQIQQIMKFSISRNPLERLKQRQINVIKDIPEQFDSREFWPKCQSIKQIRDQSTCSSQWAFAAVQSMSDRICIASGQRQQVRLSARDVLSCCGSLVCGKGCNGGNSHGAWKYFKDNGIVSQKCQPYPFAPCDHHVVGKYSPCGKNQPTPKCQNKCSISEIDYKNDLHFGKIVYSVPSRVTDIQTQILTNGPVQASFTLYSDFLTYKSGVYHHVTGSSLGTHSAKIIGWGIQGGTAYWLLANSWNEDWGDKGYFKIQRGNNQCGIQKQVVAGIPVVKEINQ